LREKTLYPYYRRIIDFPTGDDMSLLAGDGVG